MAELYWDPTFKDYASDCAECQKPIRVDVDYCSDCGASENPYNGAMCDFCQRYVHTLCLPDIEKTGCCTRCSQKYFSANGERNEVRISE